MPDDQAILKILVSDEAGGAMPPETQPAAPAAERPEPFRAAAPSAPFTGRPEPFRSAAPERTSPDTEEEDGDRGFAGLGWTQTPRAPQAFDPVAEAKKRLEREQQLAEVQAEYEKLNPVPPEPAFDPVAEAKRRIEREKKLADIQAEYAKLNPSTPQAFDPAAEAKKRLEREKRLSEIDAEYAKLNPSTPTAFDPVEEAKKRLEKEKQLAEIQAAYDKINPPAPFDVVSEVAKRRKAADQQALITQAEEQAKFQQTAFGKAFTKAFGDGAVAAGWGQTAADMFGKSFGKPHQTGMAFGGGGAAGGVAAMAGNLILSSVHPLAAAIVAGAQIVGGAFDAFIERIKQEGQIQAIEISTNDALRAEIEQNRQAVFWQRVAGLGIFNQLHPWYRQQAEELANKEKAAANIQAFNGRIQALQGFSPEIAMATQQNEIRKQQKNFAEANFAGRDYSQYVQTEGQLERQKQTLETLKHLETISKTTQTLVGWSERLNQQIQEQAKRNEQAINDQAERDKKNAKTEAERMEIEKRRLEELERLRRFIEDHAEVPLEDMLRNVRLPGEDANERKRQQELRDAQRNWHIAMGAFNM